MARLPRLDAIITNNDRNLVEKYIDAGIDPNMEIWGHGSGSLLLRAGRCTRIDIIQMLLGKGAEPRRTLWSSPSEWSILDELANWHQYNLYSTHWKETTLLFLGRGVIFSSLKMAEQLCGMQDAPHVLEVALGQGLSIHHTFTEVDTNHDGITVERENISWLHAVVPKGTPEMIKHILDRAPEQLTALEIVHTTKIPWYMLWHPTGNHMLYRFDTHRNRSPLDLAVERGKDKIVGYLLDLGIKPTFETLEGAIQLANRKQDKFYWNCRLDPMEWLEWKLQWVDLVQIIASKLDIDGAEATSLFERILEYASWAARPGGEDDGRLYLSGLLKKLSLRTQLLYADRLAFDDYENSLTEVRKKFEELAGEIDQSNSECWQAWRNKVSRYGSINDGVLERYYEMLEDIEDHVDELEFAEKKLQYIARQVKGLEEILQLRRESTLDLP
ncbi:hypothetical protein AtubIFM55763_005645 [Aspergillus tubingensis]|uniref:Ankyrin n=1 Tax=Aspergillus tubingensis TaxID=5068 RepID=A0A9W6AIX9_ASPTU|nr:hypothetical protein AtubIFM54640_004277 [Aspergillus tubingensis]GLA74403.1 hypothetical protein AtubIFM55763_005645 [Aspergillus tubingensis]GLA82683.1 hypothetical protein AtubIFM56815_006872 [Aspergillus tubingensis]